MQENSIPIQQDQVREWAEKNSVDIIREFVDPGKSGLIAEGRPAFTEMMETWVKQRDDFQYVLCLDVSRWGRFQDIDLSAQYSAECKKHGKQVIYTTIGKPREDNPLYPVYVQFERFRAAQYGKELSDKVWQGCVKIAEQSYWAGGAPPFGMQRLLLDMGVEMVPCLIGKQREAFTGNRMVNQLSAPQEMRMLRKSLEELDEKTIANALGISRVIETIQDRYVKGLPAQHIGSGEAALASAAARRFGNWAGALAAAGLEKEISKLGRTWDKAGVIAEIRARHQQGLPLSTVWKEYGAPSTAAY